MSTQLAPLSASVTRILSITGFPKELKTRDFQSAFSEWENVMGGFRIKWINDTSLLVVFADAGVAKRAYLQALSSPPTIFITSSNGDSVAVVRPYDGSDAQAIIQSVNARHNSNASRSHNSRSSISGPNGAVAHSRVSSGTTRNNGNGSNIFSDAIPESSSPQFYQIGIPNINGIHTPTGREPSPTLPSLPSHPTLDSLLSSTSVFAEESILNDPAILSASTDMLSSGPRIGDPGKRMLGAALGVRHPSFGARVLNGSIEQTLKDLPKNFNGLLVTD